MIRPSPNFQTTGIEGIKLRLKEVLHKLERDYKIKIKYNPDYVRFKKIELAFTIAFDKLPSLKNELVIPTQKPMTEPEITLKHYSHLWDGADEVITNEMVGIINVSFPSSSLVHFNGNQSISK